MKKTILFIACFIVAIIAFPQQAERNLVVVEIGTGTW